MGNVPKFFKLKREGSQPLVIGIERVCVVLEGISVEEIRLPVGCVGMVVEITGGDKLTGLEGLGVEIPGEGKMARFVGLGDEIIGVGSRLGFWLIGGVVMIRIRDDKEIEDLS